MTPFVNLLPTPELNPAEWGAQSGPAAKVTRLALPGRAWHVRGALTPAQVHWLHTAGASACTTAVGLDGILANYQIGDPVGSYRASLYSQALAEGLWNSLRGLVHWPSTFCAKGHADWDEHPHWNADGLNPLFRFIRYRPGAGELVAHYDAPFVQCPERRTLMSLVLYLTDNDNGGTTRFLTDPQDSLPFDRRNFGDYACVGASDQVRLQVVPRAGDALLMEHRLLHDSSPLLPGPDKVIIRTDVFFSKY